MNHINVDLSPEIADHLIARGAARPTFLSRSDPESLSLVIEIVGVVSDLVTIAVGTATLPAFVDAFFDILKSQHRGPDSKVKIHLKGSGTPTRATVAGDEETVKKILRALIEPEVKGE